MRKRPLRSKARAGRFRSLMSTDFPHESGNQLKILELVPGATLRVRIPPDAGP